MNFLLKKPVTLYLAAAAFLFFICCITAVSAQQSLTLNAEEGFYEKPGLNILIFNNAYEGAFNDAKMSAIELIHHDVRTATNGDVRLMPTPEQWDLIPEFVEKKVDKSKQTVQAYLRYPDYDFNYRIATQARDGGVLITVHLDEPLPDDLQGRAGFNMEFLPSAYFEKSYMMDEQTGVFPLYPSGPMQIKEESSFPQYEGFSTSERLIKEGSVQPLPLAVGRHFVLAPEDVERHVSIQSRTADLKLYDGRNKAQNGWFVVRSLIPTETSGKVIEWFLKAGTKPDWIRTPVIAHSQLGYHPNQDKTAVIELDMRDEPLKSATLFKVDKDGSLIQAYSAALESWGDFLRYQYLMFDFSSVQKSGIYVIEYGDQRTRAFRIAEDIYETAWYPSLEVYMPVQMDHMLVNEAYRVWHGASHLDDALQAPVNHTHFDLYAQGPETDSPYEPGEHIPGLNVGGWYDAGDYDIRTQTQYSVVSTLVDVWEEFGIRHDDTYVNQQTRRVELHHPDGVPDVLQQIEHGVLQLLAQHRAVGHAIPGIIVGHLHQYHHLGDGLTMTDNLIYDSDLAPHEKQGNRSGNFDDRWAFTSKSTPLNYGSAAGLAAASRALKDYKPELADECLKTAQDVWESEHSQEPDLFRSGNVTGGNLTMEELNCAIQLLRTTGDEKYADRIQELWPSLAERFNWVAPDLIPVLPELGESINAEFKEKLKSSQEQMSRSVDNPFGVPISRGTWGGGGWVTRMAVGQYKLHKAFPDIIGPDGVFKALNYIHGCHPGSSISFVSGVGTWSKKVAYGSNRADFSFIAGGVAPGVVVLKPDFPENKEDWPFFWGENEYVVSGGPVYIYAANAAHRLLNEK